MIHLDGIRELAMNEDFDLKIDTLLIPILKYLQNTQFFFYADHDNLLVELGWDLCSGDGQLVDHVNTVVEYDIERYPPMLRDWLWSKTFDYRYNHEFIEANLLTMNSGDNKCDWSIFDPDYDDEERLVVMRKLLTDRLYPIAEQAFTEYEDNCLEEE
jgi:hypothetical protein